MTALMTKTSAAELLVPIWRKVLRQPSIQLNDNFFDLGGDSASAVELFAAIAEVCCRHLSPVLIYSAPTIEALAAVLELPAPPRIPPLLLLKAASGYPPIFIAHGLGDTVLDLFRLAGRIESDRPIYGMQTRGVDGVEEPFTSVEEMAQFHLEAIQKLQPHGPYFLMGYSLGGLVVLEIAQRLSTHGEKIALLALADSYPHRNQLGLMQQVLLSFRVAKRHLWALRRRTRKTAASDDRFAGPIGHVMKRARDSAYLALKRYRPQFYPGNVKFVRAEIISDFPEDPATVWSHLAERFELETIPGDHWSMLTTQYEKLGAVLTRYVKEASISGARC
jgi:acetoacetyl-CoA synthetase